MNTEGIYATLVFNNSKIEEHSDLKTVEIENACYMSRELTIHGTKLLYDYNQQIAHFIAAATAPM